MRTPYTSSQLKWMAMVIDLFGNKVSLGYITDQCLDWEYKEVSRGVLGYRDIKIYAFDLIQAISATRKS